MYLLDTCAFFLSRLTHTVLPPQAPREGKDKKDRKDIRLSVHRLTTFLSLLIELRMSLCYLRDQ